MRWTRADLSWFWIGCALPLLGGVLVLGIAFWWLPAPDFALKPLQLDPTNPLLGEWRVIAACDTPALPRKVRFTPAGIWESQSDPTIHGTYHLLAPDHVDIQIQHTVTRYTIRVEPARLVLWQDMAHQILVRDAIQFGKCGGA